MAYCLFFSRHQLPRTCRSLAISPSSCGPSLVVLGLFPPRLGPWAYYSKWAGAPRSFGPILVIVFFPIKNISKLINQQLKNWVKIVN